MGTSFASAQPLFQRSLRNELRRIFIVGALLFLGGGWIPRARAEVSREYDLKAVLLFNLTRFVEWPSAVFASPESPLIIGVLGQDPYGQTLDDVVRTERFASHKIVVMRYRTVEAAKSCHILFISTSEQPNLSRIIRELSGRPILTVGEFDGFATGGGMVRLYQSPEGKIRLRINLAAVRTAGLSVSGKQLRLAETINVGKD